VYLDYVERLPSLYEPAWSLDHSVRGLCDPEDAHVLEIGCGPGGLHAPMIESGCASYVGYDTSRSMIHLAEERRTGAQATFTDSWADALGLAPPGGYDLVIACFVLHDAPDPSSELAAWRRALAPQGRIVLIDLSRGDLPRSVGLMQRTLALPSRLRDPRFDMAALARLAQNCDLRIECLRPYRFTMRLDSWSEADNFFTAMGVYSGMDLPLFASAPALDTSRDDIESAFRSVEWPWIDDRLFFGATFTHAPGSG